MESYVLAQLGRCKHLNHVKQVQGFLVSHGHAQTGFFSFKLVRFCALALADLRYARSIFDHLADPNVYLYAAMLTAYASLPDHPSAFALFRLMLRRGHSRPNQFVYPHVLKSSPHVSASQATGLVHAHILKSGFGGYPVVETALVDSYSRTRSRFGSARQVFDEMSQRSVVSWTAMISGYTRLGDIQEALLLFREMPDKDVPCWNSVIAGCAQNGLFSDAISIFQRMVALSEPECRPNGVTLVCVLSACTHAGVLNLGKAIHGYVYRNGLELDSFVANAMVDMYGKCARLKEAARVFNMIKKKSLASWNSMINCFALHGQSSNAIDVFEEMIHRIRPNAVTFVGLLNACVHGGLVAQGRSYFMSMTSDYGIEPQIEHYGCLIDLLGRAGRLEEALEVVRGMEIEPDEAVWSCLYNGSKIYGRTDLAEFAAKKLMDIDPNNASYCTMMANIHGELGNWDEVCKMRKMIKQHNAYKTPGCSWVEVDDQVHQFYCFDKTHSRTEEIYNILGTISLD